MASTDYLKKYLSTDDSKSKKKKKSKKSENHGGMKVVEDDAFIMVKPKSRGMPSDEEDEVDETAEEIRQKQKQAEKLKFRSDTFKPIEDLPANSNSKKQRHDSDDNTPPRRKQRHDSDDNTPPRRKQRRDSDDNTPPRKLHDFNDDELNGRFAKTIVRTKLTGKNRKGPKDVEEKKTREEKKNMELKEKYEKWNRGVAQLKQREAQLKEEERVMKEGFSRYADDEAMNEHLKDEILAEDPMAALISKKREKIEIRKGLVYPSYKGHWPPNRYNIAPGYRWDGVNRSNGFEAQLSLAANKRKADEEAAYRAITECAE